jgi:YfiH family protein
VTVPTALALLRPRWSAPPAVGAAMSTRAGGVSTGPWAALNLGLAAGDDPAAVRENRRRFAAALQAVPVWLWQVHGARVLHLKGDAAAAQAQADAEPADAAWTDEPGLACTVSVADCLPVLLCAPDGRAVAAVHAGWRGLAAGILPATVLALARGSGCAPQDLRAWLGPCIGPAAFEVGADVLQAFGVDPQRAAGRRGVARFRFMPRPDGSPRWRADLQGLARDALRAAGVTGTRARRLCTAADDSAFFSFRRDGVTGRMAAAIWRHG